jgi:hypothetical protein
MGDDAQGRQGQQGQLDQLNIMSAALDELGTVVLRAAVAEQLREEQHIHESKEQESKLKQLKHACRQLQREAKASRQARSELASQMCTLQLRYETLQQSSEQQRAESEAAGRKYDALVLKSVSLMQQLEGRCAPRAADLSRACRVLCPLSKSRPDLQLISLFPVPVFLLR